MKKECNDTCEYFGYIFKGNHYKLSKFICKHPFFYMYKNIGYKIIDRWRYLMRGKTPDWCPKLKRKKGVKYMPTLAINGINMTFDVYKNKKEEIIIIKGKMLGMSNYPDKKENKKDE